jgi:dipeptidase
MSGKQFKDIGATQSYNAYRAHPLTWESGKKTYLNERPVATQQTGWNFVAQTRPWLLGTPLAGILWFGVDDAATTVRFPIYGGALHAPTSFAGVGAQDGKVSPMMKFDMRRAFYAFNLVANWAYSRWNLIYPDVLTKITRKEAQYHDMIPAWDKKASDLFQQPEGGYKAAVEYLTEESDKIGNSLVEEWNEFFGALFVKYRDGYVITANDADTNCGCTVNNGPYPDEWYDDIAAQTGDHYLVPAGSELASSSSFGRPAARSKIDLLARR